MKLVAPHHGAGLSPRVRGNRLTYKNNQLMRRTIPACAGEPPVRRVACVVNRDYPRVCGGTWFSLE